MMYLPKFTAPLPLSLYIHIPWCVRKCPYCDFNSHTSKGSLPEELYVNALLQELDSHLEQVQNRPLVSIFFGGGTPSLFSAHAIARILDGVAKRIVMDPAVEITLEANPGTIDEGNFKGYRAAGVNRLSLGIQSLQDDKLKALGRIHDRDYALRAIKIAKEAGFSNFNLDIMFGLPNQTIADAMHDIETALSYAPTHFSWYQLTIEPNTLFYHQRPQLPIDDLIWDMQLSGQALIHSSGLVQYEVSAYAQSERDCRHNRNYWEFGDYLGIGAGAHSKMTNMETQQAVRFSQVRNPKDYLNASLREKHQPTLLATNDLIFEFMLNALRLTEGFPASLFSQRTGIALDDIKPIVKNAQQRGLLLAHSDHICPSESGKKFLNDLISMFLR
jgi:putative oxygen-independent coproporphyrinogen III oxidase